MTERPSIKGTRSADAFLPRDETPWFVVSYEPRAEKTAEESIKALGIETFLPTYVRAIRHAGKKQLVRKPLFAPYFFASFSWEHPRWQLIFSRRGVAGMITDGYQRPRPVPALQMQRVRDLAAQYEDVVCEETPLVEGQAVKIIYGPFTGKDAEVESLQNEGIPRVRVGNLPVDIPREYLAPVA